MMNRATRIVVWCLVAAIASQNMRLAAAMLDVDAILGPDHPYTSETITLVDGADPPTEVVVLDGALIGGLPGNPTQPIGFDVYGKSILTMRGGRVKGSQQSVLLHYQSVFHMLDGEIDSAQIESRDASRVALDDGNWGAVFAYDSSRVRVNGGNENATFNVRTFGASHVALNSESFEFIADELSTAVISSGNFELAYARGNSEVLVNGGFFLTGLFAFDDAVLRIRDIDSIDEEYVDISHNAVAHVYGTNLRFEVSPENRPLVLGTWPGGGNFAFQYRLFDQGQIILHEVPEPTAAPLLAIAAAILAFTRRRSLWRRSQLK